MPNPDLTDDDYRELARLVRSVIDADRFPLSPRVRRLKALLAKLDPQPLREPLPPLKPSGEPSLVVARMRNPRRRR